MPRSRSEVNYDPTHLPHSDGAEMFVLGACMLSKASLLTVLSSLQESDFYQTAHQQIYRAIYLLNEDNVDVDLHAVSEKLDSFHVLDSIGGPDYLNECCDTVTSTANLDFNISLVNNNAVLRNMLTVTRDIDYRAGTEEIDDLDIFIADSEKEIRNAAEKRTSPYFSSASEIANEVQKEIISLENSVQADEDVIGVNTGFKSLNKLTQGFKDSEVTIIGARPSMGKTALALNFAYNAATIGKVSVAIFSLEMDKKQLVRRLVASDSHVNLTDINNAAKLNTNDRNKVYASLNAVANAPIYIDDTPGQRMSEIENKAKKLKASDPNLDLIVIDYLGLIAPDKTTRSSDNRQEEVRKASLAVKNLAREMHVPIILICQLNRSVDDRGRDHRPQLSDLRESGAIEQDADVVMFLYRSDYYDRSTSKKGDNDAESYNQGLPPGMSYTDLIVAKNRNGETGTVHLFFSKNYGKFQPASKEVEERMEEVRKTNPYGED
ncbi:MAG: replicative DNA helicase [Coprobacillus sp.]|nr:replicative DNA helicase [Coprobacillus sp.]